MKRSGSRNCLNRRSRFGSRERDWLREDVKRGCVYLYGADTTTATATTTSSASSSSSSDLHLVLCTVETPASEICAGEGRESLYLQLHGDLVRWGLVLPLSFYCSVSNMCFCMEVGFRVLIVLELIVIMDSLGLKKDLSLECWCYDS